MLPEFDSLNRRWNQALARFLSARMRIHAGFFGDVPRRHHFEGSSASIERATGEVDPEFPMNLSAEIELNTNELKEMSFNQLLEKYDGLAKQMAGQQIESFFEMMHQTTEKTGNVVDAGGKPFSPELMLEALEKIEIDFNSDGSPRMPTMALGEAQRAKLMESANDSESMAIFEMRRDKIIDRKREEWRAREANRILVG